MMLPVLVPSQTLATGQLVSWLPGSLTRRSLLSPYKVQICRSCMYMSLYSVTWILCTGCIITMPGPVSQINYSCTLGWYWFCSKNLEASPYPFLRARVPHSVCTHDVTCELYCILFLHNNGVYFVSKLISMSILYSKFVAHLFLV